MTRGAISKLADRLIDKELIVRRATAGDRRFQSLALTRQGRAITPKLAALADQNDKEFFADLDLRDARDDRGGDEGHRSPQGTKGRAGRLTAEPAGKQGYRSNDMNAHVKDVVREMSEASDEERITFPEVVKALMEAGIERYHADLLAGRKTYYLPDGDFEDVEVHKVGGAALQFSAEGVEKAVRAIQRQAIAYREFCRQIADAGCVGYFVSLAGRRAVYYGRTGDEHVEWFPGAKP